MKLVRILEVLFICEKTMSNFFSDINMKLLLHCCVSYGTIKHYDLDWSPR
jgi:hypothetical protein